MSAATFTNNPNYVEYVRLLRQLHRLIAEDNDGDEADALREDMDAPWYALSEEEIARIRGLSADLYTLDETPAAPTHQDDAAAKTLSAEIRAPGKHAPGKAFSTSCAGPLACCLLIPRRSCGAGPGISWATPTRRTSSSNARAELAPHDTNPSVAVVVAQSRAGHVEEADRYARAILAPAA